MGAREDVVYYTAFDIVLIAAFAVVMMVYISQHVAGSTALEKNFLARDISLVLNTVYAAPGEVKYNYQINPDVADRLEFTIADGIIVVSDKGKDSPKYRVKYPYAEDIGLAKNPEWESAGISSISLIKQGDVVSVGSGLSLSQSILKCGDEKTLAAGDINMVVIDVAPAGVHGYTLPPESEGRVAYASDDGSIDERRQLCEVSGLVKTKLEGRLPGVTVTTTTADSGNCGEEKKSVSFDLKNSLVIALASSKGIGSNNVIAYSKGSQAVHATACRIASNIASLEGAAVTGAAALPVGKATLGFAGEDSGVLEQGDAVILVKIGNVDFEMEKNLLRHGNEDSLAEAIVEAINLK